MAGYWNLFWTFFRVGLFTFGGGAAMLPLLRAEVAEKNRWVTDEELLDYYSIGQCTPGIIAINTATFVGYQAARRYRSGADDFWRGGALDNHHYADCRGFAEFYG